MTLTSPALAQMPPIALRCETPPSMAAPVRQALCDSFSDMLHQRFPGRNFTDDAADSVAQITLTIDAFGETSMALRLTWASGSGKPGQIAPRRLSVSDTHLTLPLAKRFVQRVLNATALPF